MKVILLDYNAGNVRSVSFALERMGIAPVVSNDPAEIASADKIIFPGVGEASSAMERLRENHLDRLIPSLTQPVLGICLGMQLLCAHSEEGDTRGLGIFPAKVRKFVSPENTFKVPQVGWNTVASLKGPLFEGVPENAYVYYVHSFYAELCDETCAVTDYIQPYSAALSKNNFYAVQFHPEKSGVAGEFILRNFLAL
jgi:imidazole glycerol-phosphate synthase subunit HisH